jgi:hypothetical protein
MEDGVLRQGQGKEADVCDREEGDREEGNLQAQEVLWLATDLLGVVL